MAAATQSADENNLLANQQRAFWTNICICNNLIVERGPDGEYVYQVSLWGPSYFRTFPGSLQPEGLAPCCLCSWVFCSSIRKSHAHLEPKKVQS